MPQIADPAAGESRPNRIYAFSIAFVAAVGGFLFGYGLSIMGGAQLHLKDYFHLDPNSFGFADGFGFAVSSAMVGCMAGPIVGGWLCDLIGRKKSLILAALLFGREVKIFSRSVTTCHHQAYGTFSNGVLAYGSP